jgi:hypothetical protein
MRQATKNTYTIGLWLSILLKLPLVSGGASGVSRIAFAIQLFAKKGQFFNKLWSQHQLQS